jgi:hypothetical protein
LKAHILTVNYQTARNDQIAEQTLEAVRRLPPESQDKTRLMFGNQEDLEPIESHLTEVLRAT